MSSGFCILRETAVKEWSEESGELEIAYYETEFFEFCNTDSNTAAAAASYLNHDAERDGDDDFAEQLEIFGIQSCDSCPENCPGRAAKLAGKA
jgi:hypothetical protein